MKANINVIEKSVPFEFMGTTYPLKMTWNVLAEIAERFGSIGEALEDGGGQMRNMLEVITLLINEAVETHNEENPDDMWVKIDSRYVGRHLGSSDIKRVSDSIIETVISSNPDSENEELTDDEKNEVPSR